MQEVVCLVLIQVVLSAEAVQLITQGKVSQ